MFHRWIFRLLALFALGFSDLGPGAGGGGAPPPADPPPPAGDGGEDAPPPSDGGEDAPPADGGSEDPDAEFEGFSSTYEALLAQEGDTINGVPRSVLERHSREAKSYRERYQPIAKAMKALHPDDAAGFVQFLEAMNSGDPQLQAEAATWMREVLDHVSPAQAAAMEAATQAATGQPNPAQQTPGQKPPADDFDPFDPAAIDARIEAKAREMLERQQAEAAEAAAVAQARTQLETRAKELAAEHGIAEMGDPTTPEFALLLFSANQLADSIEDPMVRLDKAAEAIRERFAAQGQAILKAKATDAGPSPAPPEGGTPGGTRQPQTLDDAATAAAARIDAVLRGEAGT